MTVRRSTVVVVAACAVAAVVTLGLPATLAYDPWAWLVWGREAVHLDLDTTGGPSWKPLPVLVAAPLSLLGDLAPEAWLVVARIGGLLALLGVYRLAARLAGPVAGVVAAGLLVLTPDNGPRYARLVLEGHSAPFTATLTVWAVDRHLAGRRGHAVVLLTLLSLDRPEAWPFLGLYALWSGRREPGYRWALVGLLAVVPVLWFGGDWWGSGSPLHGADTAQVYAGDPGRLGIALDHVKDAVVVPAWVLALGGAAVARRRGRREVAVLAVLAVAWMTLVVAMSALLGYAALSRFLLPGAALVCVAAAVAAVAGVRALPAGTRRRASVAAAVVVCAPFVALRLLGLGSVASEIAERGRADRDLAAVLDDAGGVDRLLACGPLAIDTRDVPRPALTWRAGVPLHEVGRPAAGHEGVVVATAGGRVDGRLAAAVGVADAGTVRLAARGPWVVYAVGCAPG